MRLWDYRLIPVLPNTMLVSQWRECIAIKRQWEKGTLKHRLVSYVMNYKGVPFFTYVRLIAMEMDKRNIKYKNTYFQEIINWCCRLENENVITSDYRKLYKEHNYRYLKQCYYNLQEKYDRGIITKEEWQKIENLIGGEIE